ncbi:MAG: hypothetical protein OEV80_10725, partial [candidate division Zixibacteria bacterium]|nr:hypothetical protein [candidate division Zixibacteria bacterium]
MKHKLLIVGMVLVFGLSPVWAQTELDMADSTVVDSAELYPAAAADIKVVDKPNDHGHAVVVTWETSADDGGGKNNVLHYEIYYSTSYDGPFDSVGASPAGESTFVHIGSKDPNDGNFIPDHTDLFYQVDVVTIDPAIRTASGVQGP